MDLQPFSDEIVRAQLQKILESRPIGHGQTAKLLKFLVDETLKGEGDGLTEHTIGIDALNRKATEFDPKEDSIVRVESHRLRQKLSVYYANEGRNDSLVISLPNGGYQVRFE